MGKKLIPSLQIFAPLWTFIILFTYFSYPGTADVSPVAVLFKEKKYGEVVKELSPNIEKLKKNDLMILGQAYLELKNYPLAIKTFSIIVSQNSTDLEGQTKLGEAQFLGGKEADALNLLKKVLKTDPTNEPAYLIVAKIYEKRKNKYELRLLYQDLIANVGEKGEYVIKLCKLSTMDGLYDLSFKTCRRAQQLVPLDPQPIVYLGISYKNTENPKLAEEFLKKASHSFRKSDFAQIEMAKYYEEKKDVPSAYKYYSLATKINEDSIPAQIGKAVNGMDLEKYQDSLIAFQKVCHLDKTMTNAFRIATNQLRIQNKKEWLKKFELELNQCP